MHLHRPLLLALASLLLASPARAETPKSAVILESAPKMLPPLTYRDDSGRAQTLDTSKAKLTVLHFWATWCVPCIHELPALDATLANYKDRGLQVVALSLDGTKTERMRDFFRQHGIQRLSANYDAGQATLRTVQGHTLPLTVFINSRDEEIARANGALEWDTPTTQTFLEKALK